MTGPVTFETRETLLERLLVPRREVVFLVGAPLTAPERGSTLGIPDVAGMVSRIRARVAAERLARSALRRRDEDGGQPLPDAFGFLVATLGQDHANAVIRGGVLEAFRADAAPRPSPTSRVRRPREELDGWTTGPASPPSASSSPGSPIASGASR